jgi:hypothetical protein
LELRQEFLKASQSQLSNLKSAKYFYMKQFSFEKRAAQRLSLMKAGQDLSCLFSKAFCKSKAFCAKWQRNFLFNIKLKGQITFF